MNLSSTMIGHFVVFSAKFFVVGGVYPPSSKSFVVGGPKSMCSLGAPPCAFPDLWFQEIAF